MACEIGNNQINQSLSTSNEERIRKDEEFAMALMKQEQEELERRDALIANQLAAVLPTFMNIRNLRNGNDENEEEEGTETGGIGNIYRDFSSDNEDEDDDDDMELIIPPGNRMNLPPGIVVSSIPSLFSLLARGFSPDNIIPITFQHGDLYEQLSNLPNVPTPAKNRDQLPIREIQSPEDLKGEVCTICLCDYEKGNKIKTLPCTHNFHAECIDKWLGSNNKCPNCKRYVDEDSPK